MVELGPLAACTLLQTLKCNNNMRVTELGPLAACTLLQTLNCHDTRVSDLGPLAACALLQTLSCRAGPPCSMHVVADPLLQRD